MKIFQPLFERAILWAKHPRAPLLLTLLSFIEASAAKARDFVAENTPEAMLDAALPSILPTSP